ncbi:MAG: 2-5 ligase family protein [Chitinophagaceae bacterium]|nr:2-5 ligase family protein [Chitinophagaceae bacterium]
MEQLVKQSTTQSWNSDGFWEYLLVAHPGEMVKQKIMEEKQYFYDTYREKIAVKTLPHITIANFRAKEEMEETIIRWMARVFAQHGSFPVTLNNYSGIPEHTIFLRLQDTTPFAQLAKDLKVVAQYVESNGCPKVTLVNRPHLTIAGRLTANVYEKAMLDFSQRTFHESFEVNELVLLRRSQQYDPCKQVNVFKLQPVAVDVE